MYNGIKEYHSGNLKTGHLNTGIIQKLDVLTSGSTIEKPDENVRISNGQPFKIRTIHELIYFGPFENRTRPVFGSPLYWTCKWPRSKRWSYGVQLIDVGLNSRVRNFETTGGVHWNPHADGTPADFAEEIVDHNLVFCKGQQKVIKSATIKNSRLLDQPFTVGIWITDKLVFRWSKHVQSLNALISKPWPEYRTFYGGLYQIGL